MSFVFVVSVLRLFFFDSDKLFGIFYMFSCDIPTGITLCFVFCNIMELSAHATQ